jgi:hypothetical protein
MDRDVAPECHSEPPAYSADGVDLTLIRWMLSKSPWERLAVLEQAVASLQELRDACKPFGTSKFARRFP